MHVAVIGAGITGLSAALALRARGANVTLFEASNRVGGVITTIQRDGWLVEAGPTSLTATAPLEALIDELGLGAQRIGTQPAAKRRYIVRGGRLVALPAGPVSLATSSALSTGAKLALLREPLVPARRDVGDESLAALVRRRFNDEILDYLVNPLIAGIFAGDPEWLSVKYATPMLHDAERKHGSLLVGAVRELKARRGIVRQKGITSFTGGLQTLPMAMALALDDALCLATHVTGIERHGSGWRVAADGRHSGVRAFDAVLCATPAHALGAVGLPPEVGDACAAIARIAYPSVATLALGFRRNDVPHPLDGFGVLMPAVEGRSLLGAIFSSSVFEGRAPAGHVLLTCFLGGVRQPGLARLSLPEVLPRALEDLRLLLGVRGAPIFQQHQVWERAIPQYGLEHEHVLRAAERIETVLPGVFVAGQWRAGAALGDCIVQGQLAAARVAATR